MEKIFHILRMARRPAAAAFVALTLALPGTVFAAAGTPTIIGYQGRLTDASGNLLGGSGTAYYFKFSIWNVSSGGVADTNRLWPSSAPTSVSLTVRNGVFNANIGDTDNGFPDALTYDFNTDRDVFLQVEVSSDNATFQTLTPRQRIGAAPFARLSGAVSGTGPSSFGTTTPFGTSVVSVAATSTTSTAFSLRAFLGQLANLFQIQDSTGVNLFSISAAGGLFASSTLQATGLSTLYGGILSNAASSTITNLTTTNATTTTLAVSGTASTSALIISNGFFQGDLADCSSESQNILYTASTGKFSCGFDATGGGGGAELNWTYVATEADSSRGRIYVSTTTNQVVIGASATSSSARLEVVGGIFVTGASSTIANLSTLLSTSTSATSTNLFSTKAVFTNATSTTLAVSETASTTNLVISSAGTGSTKCLQISGTGLVSAAAAACGSGGGSSFGQSFELLSDGLTLSPTTTAKGLLINAASSTITNLVSVNATSTNATTTALAVTGIASGNLVKTTTGGALIAAVAGTDFEIGLTAGDGLTRTTNDFDCDTASASVFGCLTAAHWSLFNNKVSSTSIDSLAEIETLTSVTNILIENDIDASSELAALIDDETGSGSVVFSQNPLLQGLISNASSTIFNLTVLTSTTTAATSTNLAVTGTASTTNLVISAAGTGSTKCLQVSGSGLVSAAAGECGTGGGYTTVQNEGTPLTQRSVINFVGTGVDCVDDGADSTDCTVSAGAATAGGSTGSIQFNNANAIAGNNGFIYDFANTRIGLGTTTPYAMLAIHATSSANGTTLFTIASSTSDGTATSTLFSISNTGALAVAGASAFASTLNVTGLTTLADVTASNATTTSLYVASLSGPLQANAGRVSATTSVTHLYGGTGLTAAPSFGQILRGTGSGYALVATSTLGIAIADTTGTLAATRGGTGLSTVTLNQILVGAVGNTWAQVATSSLGIAIADTTGTLAAARGGTGVTSFGGANTLLYTTSVNTLSSVALGTAGQVLAVSGGVPAWVATTTFSGGLTYAGGNVTLNTGNANIWTALQTFIASLGVGTTSPFAKLSVHATNGETNRMLFAIASSTANATTTLFSVDNTGLTTIGDASGTGDSSLQFADDTDAWSVGFDSSDKGFKIASSTNFSANIMLAITKSGTLALSSGITTSNTGQYLCIDATTFEIIRNNTACSASSQRFKENIFNLNYGLDEVLRLRPVTFTFRPGMNWGTSTQLGFIAEEVEAVVPELVSYDNDGVVTSVNYPVMVSLLTKAIQDLDLRLEDIASTTVISTPDSSSFSERFFSNAFARIRMWLADAANGVEDLFANRVRTRELCVGDGAGETCITKAQLDALLSGQGASASSDGGESAPAPIPASEPAPEPAPEAEPTSEAALEPASEPASLE